MKLLLLAGILMAATVSAQPQQKDFTSSELKNSKYQLLRRLHDFGRKERMLNIPAYDGRLLQMLVRMTDAKNILEIGTSNGVSTIWMGLVLKDTGGHITTLEIDPKKVELAGKNFTEAGVAEVITIMEGDALKALPKLTGSFDLVFIDAAKEQYKDYLDAIYDKIPSGGVIVAHNAVRQARSMQNYLDHVQDHPSLDTVVLQTGNDGMALSYKR
jgi:caffeoyl-CoA O-methyltransferase